MKIKQLLVEAITDYKTVNGEVFVRKDKGEWKKSTKNIEFKKNGDEVLHRIDKANWNPLPKNTNYIGDSKY